MKFLPPKAAKFVEIFSVCVSFFQSHVVCKVSSIFLDLDFFRYTIEENKWYHLDPQKVELEQEQEQESDTHSTSEDLDESIESGTLGGSHW